MVVVRNILFSYIKNVSYFYESMKVFIKYCDLIMVLIDMQIFFVSGL